MTGYEWLVKVLREHPKTYIGVIIFSVLISMVSFSGVASHLRVRSPETIRITKNLDELLITLRKAQADSIKNDTLEGDDVEIKGDIKTIE